MAFVKRLRRFGALKLASEPVRDLGEGSLSAMHASESSGTTDIESFTSERPQNLLP